MNPSLLKRHNNLLASHSQQGSINKSGQTTKFSNFPPNNQIRPFVSGLVDSNHCKHTGPGTGGGQFNHFPQQQRREKIETNDVLATGLAAIFLLGRLIPIVLRCFSNRSLLRCFVGRKNLFLRISSFATIGVVTWRGFGLGWVWLEASHLRVFFSVSFLNERAGPGPDQEDFIYLHNLP